jgi:hypothetical protein
MCTSIIFEYSFIDQSTACQSPSADAFYVSPGISPGVGEFIYFDSLCTNPINDGWFIDFNVDPDVVYVVTGGSGEITQVTSCTTQVTIPSPLTYTISVTGTCQSDVGTACFSVSGGTPGYTVDWISPNLGTGFCKTNLLDGSYVVRINDSASPTNNIVYAGVSISGGLSVLVTNVVDTQCGLDNGQVDIAIVGDNNDVEYTLFSGSTIIQQQVTTNGFASFFPLPSGVYSVTAISSSNCSGSTPSFIINPSQPFDFGLYVINDTECNSPTGKIYVTGQTGNAPYTYLWSTNQTNSFITGLTAGSYSVTVTNALGCSVTKSALVDFVPALGLGSWSAVQPSCYSDDGSLTLTITGGTGPYFYSGSNGTTIVTYSQNYTYTNLPAGSFFVDITDAALCKAKFSTNLMTPQSFYGVSINITEPTCSNNNGIIDISLQGGTPPYTYSIASSGVSFNTTTNSTQFIFNNLVGGEYSIEIVDGGECPYIDTVELVSVNLFEVSTTSTTASCGLENGTLTLNSTEGGTLPYTYTLSNGQSITSPDYNVTFSSLSGGSYTYTVTDLDGCSYVGVGNVPDLTPLQFSLFATNCGIDGNSGTITALITQGQPPFTYQWSDNVLGNPQDVYITGLTSQTYGLTLTDANGCNQFREVLITCDPVITTYQTYTMCESDFIFTSGTKNGLLQMLNQGFQDVVGSNEDCILTQSEFTISVEVSGVTYSSTFYSGTTLLDVPTDTQYFQEIENLLLTIPNVTNVEINENTGEIKIFSEDLGNQKVSIELIIEYIISCPTECP